MTSSALLRHLTSTKKPLKPKTSTVYLAEREGFEPMIYGNCKELQSIAVTTKPSNCKGFRAKTLEFTAFRQSQNGSNLGTSRALAHKRDSHNHYCGSATASLESSIIGNERRKPMGKKQSLLRLYHWNPPLRNSL